MIDNNALMQAVDAYRAKRNISTNAFAHQHNVDHSYLVRIRQNERTPSRDYVLHLLHSIGTDQDTIDRVCIHYEYLPESLKAWDTVNRQLNELRAYPSVFSTVAALVNSMHRMATGRGITAVSLGDYENGADDATDIHYGGHRQRQSVKLG